jgi:hypothetical protein
VFVITTMPRLWVASLRMIERGTAAGLVISVWNVVTIGLRHAITNSSTSSPHSPG